MGIGVRAMYLTHSEMVLGRVMVEEDAVDYQAQLL